MSYFRLLGLNETANVEDVKRAFRKKALELHPDVSPGDSQSNTRFILVRNAYESLLDEIRSSEVRGYSESSASANSSQKVAGRPSTKKEKEPHYFDNDLNFILWDFEDLVLAPKTPPSVLRAILDFLTYLDASVLGPSGFPCFPISGTKYGSQSPLEYRELLFSKVSRVRLPYSDCQHYYYDVRDRTWTFLLSLDKDVLAGDLERRLMARVSKTKGQILQSIGIAQNMAFHYFSEFRKLERDGRHQIVMYNSSSASGV